MMEELDCEKKDKKPDCFHENNQQKKKPRDLFSKCLRTNSSPTSWVWHPWDVRGSNPRPAD